ncbi:MAG: Holliday junction resolvase RuvX [Prevotellaceae bacterium]|nr:Holliday junction resolvase RuvX [Prevotellaceae bacterium]
MARIIAIDYGKKRVGLAVTDPLQLIATPLEVVETPKIMGYLSDYLGKESVERFVVGMPKDLKNRDADATPLVEAFVKQLRRKFPEIPIELIDERFTSKIAFQAMIDGGVKKMDRRDKGLIDRTSAVIILQSYMEANK